jgi:hypothetical protein
MYCAIRLSEGQPLALPHPGRWEATPGAALNPKLSPVRLKPEHQI